MGNDSLMYSTITMTSVDTLSKQQNEARKEFESAGFLHQMLKAFRNMEDCFPQSDLGLECLTLARKLFLQGRAHNEVLRFGKKALKILNANQAKNIPCFGNTCSAVYTDHDNGATCSVYHKSSLFIAYVLKVLAAACVDLNRFDDAFGYLNLADKELSGLELEEDSDDSCCSGDCVLRAIIGTQFQMLRVKVLMNNFDQAAIHMKKILKVKEKILEEDCIELGETNRDVGLLYYIAINYKEALPFWLKAVEIHTKHLGRNSMKVAEMRSTLGCIYGELGEDYKADEQRRLADSVLKKKPTDCNSPDSLIEAGRYEEAIAVLNGVLSREDMMADERASGFISMAKAFYKLRKFSDAKKHLRTARRLLEKKDLSLNYAAILFEVMSRLYEEMGDSETALSMTKRVLAIPELPQHLRSNSSSRLFSLIFLPAKDVDEMIKAFKEIEAFCEEPELGLGCLKIANELHKQGRSPEEVISFGNRALRILIAKDNNNNPCSGKTFSKICIRVGKTGTCTHNHEPSLYVACACNLLASACLELKRYNEGLSYLNWGNNNLSKLGEVNNSPCTDNCESHVLQTIQQNLWRVKMMMGRSEEAILHLRKKLEIQENVMEEGSIELGRTYGYISGAFFVLRNYDESLPFCLKALEVQTKHLGCHDVKVARMMGQLAVIYNELGECEKALEQNQLSLDILKKTTPSSPELLDELLEAENDSGKILIGLGRNEEAVDVLKRVVSRTDKEGSIKATSFITLASAFYHLGKFVDTKKYMRTAQRILEKKEMNPMHVAIGFGDMSKLYEKMNDLEKAISLLKRALSISEIPQKLLVEDCTRLFSLIALSGKEKEETLYMEDVVENLKEKFGPEHCEVAYGYRNLGAAYLRSGQEELAVKFMGKAKDIMDVTLGPHHLDSLKTSQALAETYATMRSYHQAVDIQERLVEGLKSMVPSEENFLAEAVTCLNRMKEMETDEVAESPQPNDLTATNSRGGSSEDRTFIIK